MKKQTRKQRILAQYASNGWNDGILNQQMESEVYQDAKGFEAAALEARRQGYENGQAERKRRQP